jgi:hypothetical protein
MPLLFLNAPSTSNIHDCLYSSKEEIAGTEQSFPRYTTFPSLFPSWAAILQKVIINVEKFFDYMRC